MAEGRSYIAYSEEAMAEQIAQLTTIVSQQAAAIQNLSTSIAHLSQRNLALSRNQYSDHAEPPNHILNHDIAVIVPSTSKMTPAANDHRGGRAVAVKRVMHPIKREDYQHSTPTHSVKVQARKKAKLTNGSAVNYAAASDGDGEDGNHLPTQGEHDEDGLPALDTMVNTGRSTAGMLRNTHATLGPTGVDAKNRFLSYLQALRENYSLDECKNVLRPQLCDDWIAVRPEELLNRLRDIDVEVPSRQNLMDIVQAMGPDIARGRSVKFGRETRRAVAVPRAYFDAQELRNIDDWFVAPPISRRRPDVNAFNHDEIQPDDEDAGAGQEWPREAEAESD
ncbi:uncharacterized protein LOC129599917 [Paramacrobiotus metropolitanus]|uniref:uncharacterized protein LOC129599917 n=1 Tax=Paramacrobiotus metropolitanus TaxID=2943436 RepID=UPI002445F063|nr:uncharacterized protein LOC129599917 [Paramacrobiotus metropolitanus]XP_055354249.1 uncharacterized protein LOC129599917 [Paramacrobiotus metropolitanus]